MIRFLPAISGFFLLILSGLTSVGESLSAKTRFPLKVSANGRQLTYQDGSPFLVVADAAWQLLRKLNYQDAVQYLDIRKSQSINTILIHLLPAQPNQKNIHNVAPFKENNNLAKPDEAYFSYLEKILVAAKERDLVVAMIISRKSWNTLFEAQGEAVCRSYGSYLSKKFSKFPNLIWVIGEEENQEKFVYRALSEGLKEHPVNQLIASFSSCSPTSLSDSAEQPDMKFIVPDTTVSVSEYASLYAWQKKIGQNYHRPFVVANLELPKEIADQSAIIRNQAYQSVLSGSAGFCHSSTIKNFHTTWKVNITRDGAEYLAHFSKILNHIPREFMEPDSGVTLTPDSLDRDEISTFFLSNKRMAMLYIPSSRTIKLNLAALTGEKFVSVWYSPRTGKRWPGGDLTASENVAIVPPDLQAAWDWILLIGSKN
jgi:hypothetical protein